MLVVFREEEQVMSRSLGTAWQLYSDNQQNQQKIATGMHQDGISRKEH